MAVYKRQEVPALLKGVERGEIVPVYLLFGERYLCQEIANDLVCRLLPDEALRLNSLKIIDGDQEEVGATINMLKTYSLFGTRQVLRVMDSQILYSKVVAGALWDKARKGWEAKEPKKALRFLTQMLALADLAPADWEKEELAACTPGRWQELFGFAKPDELAWVQEACAASDGGGPVAAPKVDGAELLMATLETGIPPGNTLILVAEAADKRKKLFKYLEKNCVVIDLSVDTGASSAARKDQEALLKEIVQQSLARFGKKLEPRALPVLLERVGFQPVAVAMEAEKLALSVGEAETITMDDLNAMVGRTREEALYELNEAFGNHDLAASLTSVCRKTGCIRSSWWRGCGIFCASCCWCAPSSSIPPLPIPRGSPMPPFKKDCCPGCKRGLARGRRRWPAIPLPSTRVFSRQSVLLWRP
jgi:DNA polymerase-3 subunit delta